MKYSLTLFKKIVPYAFFVIGCGYVSAQDADTTEEPSIETMMETNMLIVPGHGAREQSIGSDSDSAYIYQIGVDNIVKVKMHGKNNELKLMQHGNANTADVNVSGKTLVHNTLQNGNGNVFMEYGNAPHLNLERQILQDGNNQNLVIFGSNALTESIRLSVQGDAQALTIRSFN